MKVLIPAHSRFFPSQKQREHCSKILNDNPPENFECYKDWFFFLHIDPVQRWIHAFGMIVGSIFFILMCFQWNILTLLFYLLGVFFFYGLGIISHLLYDGGSAKSHPRYFHVTFLKTVEFNIATIFGNYDKLLRKFLEKYPDVNQKHNLVEVERSKLISFLFKGK